MNNTDRIIYALEMEGYNNLEPCNDDSSGYILTSIKYKTKDLIIYFCISYAGACCGIKYLSHITICGKVEKEFTNKFFKDVAKVVFDTFNCGAILSIQNKYKWEYFEGWDLISEFTNGTNGNRLKHFQLLNPKYKSP